MRLFVLLLLLSVPALAQKKTAGPVTVNGLTFTTGDTLTLGYGTMPNGDFKGIYRKPNLISLAMFPLHSSWSQKQAVIREFIEGTTNGQKFYAVLKLGTVTYVVDLGLALHSKEIERLNGKPLL